MTENRKIKNLRYEWTDEAITTAGAFTPCGFFLDDGKVRVLMQGQAALKGLPAPVRFATEEEHWQYKQRLLFE